MLWQTELNPEADAVEYCDGSEATVLDLLRAAPDLSSTTAIAHTAYGDWPIRYHLCPERSALLRPFDFSGLRVLELGCGMGGVSRYLAESCAHLTVVEGSHARMDACRERLRDLRNWKAHVGNIQNFVTDERFDAVCLIGVLEYAECFVTSEQSQTPFDAMLSKALSLCRDEGVVIVAIENKLGLKYWAGASEDHLGQRFSGVAGYPDSPSPRTFCRKDLLALMRRNGMDSIREFYPFPDYKIPDTILTRELIDRDPRLAADLAALRPFEDYAKPRAYLLPEALATVSITSAGLLPDLANSFLFIGSRTADSPVLRQLCVPSGNTGIGWHYSLSNRTHPVITSFHADAEGMSVSKRRLSGGNEPPGFVRWHGESHRSLSGDPTLLSLLRRQAYFSDWPAFESLVGDFLRWSFERWTSGAAATLDPRSVDATITNATIDKAAVFDLFDLEWELDRPVDASWFILRNLLAIHEIQAGSGAVFPYPTLMAWYEALCRSFALAPAIDTDLDREITFRAATCAHLDRHAHAIRLREIMSAPLPTLAVLDADFTQIRDEHARFLSHIAALEAERALWIAQRESPVFRLAARTSALLGRVRILKKALRPFTSPRAKADPVVQ